MTKRICLDCRYWMPSSEGEAGRVGVCRKPALSTGFTGWQQTDATDRCDDWTELAWFEGNDGKMHVDRRSSARTSVDYPARLQTAGGDWSGRLTDMSETGARLHLRAPPKKGVHALLRCGGNEIFCKIAWSAADSCGLAFDRPISSSLVFEVGGRSSEQAQNVADVTKIPVGKKRERLHDSSLGQASFDTPGEEAGAGKNVVSLEDRRPQSAEPTPAAAGQPAGAEASFESRDELGYIKFYDFRAMANP